MSQAGLPLLLFGDVENFDTAWSKVNSATVSTGVTDPFGGTGAYTVNDASGAATRYLQKTIALESGVVRCSRWFIFKAGTATDNVINWRDTTASADRRTVKITWAGGVPTLTSLVGSSTLDLVVSVGGGFYAIRIGIASILTANTNVLQLMPAATTTSDTASTGTVTVFSRSLVYFSRPIDDPTTYTMKRPGSTIKQIASGARDAWDLGDAQFLAAVIRFVPPSDWDDATKGTGWEGRGEDIGTNVGYDALFRAAGDATLMRFCPSQAAVSSYSDCYLEPLSGKPDTEQMVLTTGLAAVRRIPLMLSSYGDVPFEGY